MEHGFEKVVKGVEITEAQILRLQPGDVLHVNVEKRMCNDGQRSFEKYLRQRLPEGVNVVVSHGGGCQMEVIRPWQTQHDASVRDEHADGKWGMDEIREVMKQVREHEKAKKEAMFRRLHQSYVTFMPPGTVVADGRVEQVEMQPVKNATLPQLEISNSRKGIIDRTEKVAAANKADIDAIPPAVQEAARQITSSFRRSQCPDCGGTGTYQPLVGPAEPCRTCQT